MPNSIRNTPDDVAVKGRGVEVRVASDVQGPSRTRVAIVGAGFTGTILASRLLHSAKDAPLDVILIEKAHVFGLGLAYGAARETNLLNVPAGNMSASHDDAGHFLRWAQSRDPNVATGDFLPRRLYGEYLQSILNDAARACENSAASATSGVRLVREQAEVVDLVSAVAKRHAVVLADGRKIECDAVVLCLGNFPPGGFGADVPLDIEAAGFVVMDPWSDGALDGLGATGNATDADVLLVGTGLTMIDIAAELKARGHRGVILAISRRGLLSASHRSPSKAPATRTPLVALDAWDGTVRSLVRLMRSAVNDAAKRHIDWRDVVASIRSVTPSLWMRMNDNERRRFLRHVRPYWEVARHRLPPSVANAVQSWIRDGSLRIASARITAIEAEAASPAQPLGVNVRIRHRAGKNQTEPRETTLHVARVINCTGPQSDVSKITQPLVQALLKRGVIRPDPLRLGVDCTSEGEAISATGVTNERVLIAGPLRKGQLWETTAVPELRSQVVSIADRVMRLVAARLD